MTIGRSLDSDPIEEARRQWVEHGWGSAADGMAAVTSIGAGASNTVIGLATAYTDSTSVLVITGGPGVGQVDEARVGRARRWETGRLLVGGTGLRHHRDPRLRSLAHGRRRDTCFKAFYG